MASYDIKDFDVYKYDVLLRPDGVTSFFSGITITQSGPLKPYYFEVPPNFFVFPNQKCYFYLHTINLGKDDLAKVNIEVQGMQTFLSMDLPSHFQRSNFGGGVVTIDKNLVEHTQSALIRAPFGEVSTTGASLGREFYANGTFQSRSVCIPPPFGQPVTFTIKKQSTLPVATNGVVTYNSNLVPVDLSNAVSMTFSILVEKKPYEKMAERY